MNDPTHNPTPPSWQAAPPPPPAPPKPWYKKKWVWAVAAVGVIAIGSAGAGSSEKKDAKLAAASGQVADTTATTAAAPATTAPKAAPTTVTTAKPTTTTTVKATTTTTEKLDTCAAVREALLTGTQAQINGALAALQADKTADATAREYADYYLHRDAPPAYGSKGLRDMD
ncbi:MAG: hypothetical protein LC792_23150, partial [Actinobacteria bacterium]|nr:hypothetical protein [Actinomycetota bacterium]